jgi:hypothetical protein
VRGPAPGLPARQARVKKKSETEKLKKKIVEKKI